MVCGLLNSFTFEKCFIWAGTVFGVKYCPQSFIFIGGNGLSPNVSQSVPGVFLMSSILFGLWHTTQVQQSQYTVNDRTLWLSHAPVVKQRIMKPHHNVADCVFVCSQSYWDHLFNGRLEERMSGDKAADHRGHLQDLLVVIPIINMSHLVLSCSNYHWHRLRSYDWAVQTAHC